MTTGIRGLAIVAAAAALGVWVGVRLARPASPPPSMTTARPESAERLQRLDGRIDALDDSMAIIERGTRVAPQPGEVAERDPASDSVEPPLSEREAVTAIAFELDSRFADDPDDSQWGADTERVVADLLEGVPAAGNALLSADCRSTMCRVEISHTDRWAREDLLSHVPGKAPFDHQVFFHPGELDGDRLVTVFYLSRAGHRLMPDEPS